jgi:hypothetical protein
MIAPFRLEMKPGDHPEFFRFPAPEGRSRESSIRLDREGRFWHDGALVEHPGMQRAFATWIDRHPDDGRFILNNGYDWTYFSVDDVPYFVRALAIDSDGASVVLSDDSREPLDPATLRVDERGAVYISVKRGRFQARFLPEAQASLGPLLVEQEDGALALEVGGRRYPIAHRGD